MLLLVLQLQLTASELFQCSFASCSNDSCSAFSPRCGWDDQEGCYATNYVTPSCVILNSIEDCESNCFTNCVWENERCVQFDNSGGNFCSGFTPCARTRFLSDPLMAWFRCGYGTSPSCTYSTDTRMCTGTYTQPTFSCNQFGSVTTKAYCLAVCCEWTPSASEFQMFGGSCSGGLADVLMSCNAQVVCGDYSLQECNVNCDGGCRWDDIAKVCVGQRKIFDFSSFYSDPGVGIASPCDIHDCNWYVSCLEEKQKCGKEGYALSYGAVYCGRYSNAAQTLSLKANKWAAAVRVCLQQALAPLISHKSCDEIKDFAFASHAPCYIKEGVCDLSREDWLAIKDIICGTEVWSCPEQVSEFKAWEQAIDVALTCATDHVVALSVQVRVKAVTAMNSIWAVLKNFSNRTVVVSGPPPQETVAGRRRLLDTNFSLKIAILPASSKDLNPSSSRALAQQLQPLLLKSNSDQWTMSTVLVLDPPKQQPAVSIAFRCRANVLFLVFPFLFLLLSELKTSF
eukprot:gb/GEZN01006106.1/.p1 GENE.gb/GEZN01006106.1/~~gb/GEZN01006106.1/.p1  ORF type:complete len:512 (+),score=31.99 gb/GEZN01006106.1/:50-1585(+)